MKFDVEVISREIIKPATSTPDHLHHFKYSLVDQLISSSFYTPLIYFYSLDHKLSNNEKSSHLKTSLSQVLNHFYPLAGVIKDNYVDCKNGGVLVLEAQVNCQLSQILQNPHPGKFNDKFLPDTIGNNLVLAIQINFFDCGSIAIGVRLAHKIADGLSFVTFVKNWAETACGNNDNVCPKFVGASLFPPILDKRSPNEFPIENNIVLKRFVFFNSNISALKEKYVITSSTEKSKIYPTRFEALTSFIFSRFLASNKKNTGPKKNYVLSAPMNLRKRMDPPLSDDSFGNISGSAITIISSHNDPEEEGYDHGLVNKLREAIHKFDKDFAKKHKEGIFDLYSKEVFEDKTLDIGELVFFNCSSFCRFPFYEADFGWGKPMWVTFGDLSARNYTILMDTRNGDGIEAWIHLTEEQMANFETDKQLLTYASSTPCP
ncbi:hypothetical protein ACOSQ3_022148 [Xanthoceras sorbifolium]